MMAAVNEAYRQRRQRRRAQLTIIDGRQVNPGAPHGTGSGYTNWFCRCLPCTAAMVTKRAIGDANRRASRVEIDGRMVAVDARNHGTDLTYTTRACRCVLCTDAHRRTHAHRRKGLR